jgi:hypothetical protein
MFAVMYRKKDKKNETEVSYEGHYFSFKTGGNPKEVVDRFELRQKDNILTYYRNGPVGSKSSVKSSSAK